MSKNKVKKLRMQLGMSQRELATQAGTSQQQIQRIEAGKITTSLQTAKAISGALGKPLETVFPAAAKALASLASQIQETGYIADDALSKVADGGVEADPSMWTLKLLLKGHNEPNLFPISASEKRRLYALVQNEEEGTMVQFLVFDTTEARHAINLAEITFCQFLFDAAIGHNESHADATEAHSEHNVQILMAGGGPTLDLAVDSDDDEEEGQLSHMLFMLESGTLEPNERVHIVDEDGEHAFIRVGSVAHIKVSLWALNSPGIDDDDD